VSAGVVAVPAAPTLAATATITLSPSSGPPSSTVKVSGSNFAPGVAIDVYFDTTDVALVGASATGTFTKIGVTVPASAVPGIHWISAVTRGSGAMAQKPFTVRANWAEHGFGPRGKRYNPYENTLNPSTVPGLDVDWTAVSGSTIDSSPAVANGVVYVGSEDSKLYAFNATTGAVLWTATTGTGIYSSSPAVANGVVYVGSVDGNLSAFNATTGAPLWNATTGNSMVSSPAVANGVVYVGSGDKHLYAFDLNNANNAETSVHTRPQTAALHPDPRLRPKNTETTAARR